MDEKSDQILDHIETQRNQLGANLNELEDRVRRTADWRAQFDKNPMLMLGAALGGGLLLGAVVSGSRSRSGTGSYTSSRHFTSSSGGARSGGLATAHQKQQASQSLDYIKAALIAFGISRAKEFLTHALPGFERHLSDAERHGPRSFASEQATGYDSGFYNRSAEYSGGVGSGSYGQQTSGSGQGANYGAPGTPYTSSREQ